MGITELSEKTEITGIKNPITASKDFTIYSSTRLLQGYASAKEDKNSDFEVKVSELSKRVRFILPFKVKESGEQILNGKGVLYFVKDVQEIKIANLASVSVESSPAQGIELQKETSVFMHYPEGEAEFVFLKEHAIGQIFNTLTVDERNALVAIQPSPIGRLAFFGGTPVLEYSIRLYQTKQEKSKQQS